VRILKKSLALIIAFTMLTSLIVVNVSATGEPTTKFILKYGDSVGTAAAYKTTSLTTVALDLYYTAADGSAYTGGGMNYWIFFDKTLYTNVTFTKGSDFSGMKKQGSLAQGKIGCYLPADADTGVAEYGPDKKLGTFTFTFNTEALVDAEEAVFNNASGSGKKSDFLSDEVVDLTDANFTLSLEDALVITGLKAPVTIADKKVGTAQVDLGLPATVTTTAIKAINNADADDVADVAVEWTGYDSTVLGEQVLTGTLTDPDGDGEGVSIASDAVIQATVTLLPLGTDDTTVTITADAEALKVKEGEVKTAEEVAAIVKAAITKIEFAGNGLTREISKDAANINFNKTDATVAGTEVVDDTIAITVEFNDVDSEDGIFDGVVKTDSTTVAILIIESYKLGDVNGDTFIDGADVLEVIAYITAESNGSTYTFRDGDGNEIPAEAAMVTDDEFIDGADVLELISYITAESNGIDYIFPIIR